MPGIVLRTWHGLFYLIQRVFNVLPGITQPIEKAEFKPRPVSFHASPLNTSSQVDFPRGRAGLAAHVHGQMEQTRATEQAEECAQGRLGVKLPSNTLTWKKGLGGSAGKTVPRGICASGCWPTS